LAITLPNDIADTLERRMAELALSEIPGVRKSRSAYIATSVKVQLIKEGCNIVANDDNKTRRRKKKMKHPVTTSTPVAGVADYNLDDDPVNMTDTMPVDLFEPQVQDGVINNGDTIRDNDVDTIVDTPTIL